MTLSALFLPHACGAAAARSSAASPHARAGLRARRPSLVRRGCVRLVASGVRQVTVATASGQSPEQAAKLQAELAEAMKDPAKAAAVAAQAEALKKALATPQAQAQLAEMNAFMTNPAIQQKLAALQSDPELKDLFEALKTGGPSALMKFWNDEALLAKISAKLGPTAGAGPARPPAAAAKPPEEVTNLFEAARWGDLEAVEDFISIGKSANDQDNEGRTPLHFAVAFGREEAGIQIVKALLDGGAKLDVVDRKNNTALHYAAGYGRPEYAELLLDAGASPSARNDTGKTPLDLVKLNGANPVNQATEVMKRLGAGSFFQDQ